MCALVRPPLKLMTAGPSMRNGPTSAAPAPSARRRARATAGGSRLPARRCARARRGVHPLDRGEAPRPVQPAHRALAASTVHRSSRPWCRAASGRSRRARAARPRRPRAAAGGTVAARRSNGPSSAQGRLANCRSGIRSPRSPRSQDALSAIATAGALRICGGDAIRDAGWRRSASLMRAAFSAERAGARRCA